MRYLAGNNVVVPLLKSLERLPNGTQSILVALNEHLDQLVTGSRVFSLTYPFGFSEVKMNGNSFPTNPRTPDFAHLKTALSKAFPAISNKKDLEIKCYASQQRRDQEPTNFIYDLLKLHEQLELGMSEEALVDHIFVRLEPQVKDYVETRLEWRRMPNTDESRRNWRNSELFRGPRNGRNDYRGDYENGRQGNQWFDSKNRIQRVDRRFNDRGYQLRNGGQNDDFSRVDRRNRGSNENFSRGDRRQMGRLNVLKFRNDQNDETQSANEVPTKLYVTCMSPMELPYVPILLKDTFTKALWDTDTEKSFISEDTYRKYFFISK
ncbi:uncharacterized protein TNCV_1881141 [Trichonephila clavipes]|nr:uncharacterized protein TNCV_1881141 [Trichonephila clavipes]